MLGYIDDFYNKNLLLDSINLKIVWNGDVVWVCNFIKIIEYSHEIVKLKVKNNAIIIEGDNIIIKMLDKKEVVLQGVINKIYFEKQLKASSNEKSI